MPPYLGIDDVYKATSYLEHYGVLGMKWGVRHDPIRKGRFSKFNGYSRDEDIKIRKNTVAYRVQAGSELKPGQSYISFDAIDHMKYLECAASGSGGVAVDAEYKNGDSNLNSIKMILNKGILMPSYERTMEAYLKTFDTKKKAKQFIKETFNKKTEKEKIEKFMRGLKNADVDIYLDESYMLFTSKFMRNSQAKNEFFKTLKNKGYNAIIDENDYQFGNGYTKTPVLIFDSSDLTKKGSKQLTKEDMSYFSELFWGTNDTDEERKIVDNKYKSSSTKFKTWVK